MFDWYWYQYLLVGIIFIWSGFVRSSLGFGGVLLALPFLLLVDDRPLIFLPIIGIQLLVFASITVYASHRKSSGSQGTEKEAAKAQQDVSESIKESTVDWRYLGHALSIMIVPKIIGVMGILTLPAHVMSGIIFSIVAVYAVSYILNRPFHSKSKTVNNLFLILGGYASGTSLTAAPLIVTVFNQHVAREKLRDTLFVLWFILVAIKLTAFVFAGVDLQLIHQLWLLPCAWLGHVMGLRMHTYMLASDTRTFYRILGAVLLGASIIGIAKAFFL